MEINRFGIKLRLAEIDDASFILKIRNHEKKHRFISKSVINEEKQKEWLTAYKEREKQKKEYYFIGENKINGNFATYRIYNIQNNVLEIGSWITIPDLNSPIDAIKVDFIVKDFVFNTLNFEKLKFDVRKLNRSVINYHKKYSPQIIAEDEDNYYFELTKDNFERSKEKFEHILNK